MYSECIIEENKRKNKPQICLFYGKFNTPQYLTGLSLTIFTKLIKRALVSIYIHNDFINFIQFKI